MCSAHCVWLFVTPWTISCQVPSPWNIPGKNTGGDCHFLLQRIFLTQGLNPQLLVSCYWQADSLPLHHWGSQLFHYSIAYAKSGFSVCILTEALVERKPVWVHCWDLRTNPTPWLHTVAQEELGTPRHQTPNTGQGIPRPRHCIPRPIQYCFSTDLVWKFS